MVSIRRSGMMNAAVRIDAAPVVLPGVVGLAALECEMIEAVRLTWRLSDLEAGSGSSWGRDGPWRQMLREAHRGDYDARGGELVDLPTPRIPMTAADHARIERAAGWLAELEARPARAGQTSAASDGAIVAAVLRQKAAGRSQVDWAAVLRVTGLARGKGALRFRYDRAMGWLAVRVAKG